MIYVIYMIYMIYKAPLRKVPRGVVQERIPSMQHLTACADKMYLVVVKTMFSSAAREAGGGEAPPRGLFALSPSQWRTVKKWQSRQHVSSTGLGVRRGLFVIML